MKQLSDELSNHFFIVVLKVHCSKRDNSFKKEFLNVI